MVYSASILVKKSDSLGGFLHHVEQWYRRQPTSVQIEGPIARGGGESRGIVLVLKAADFKIELGVYVLKICTRLHSSISIHSGQVKLSYGTYKADRT